MPSFAYGPERTLPEVRREAFRGLGPTAGPPAPHPTAGATAVGARPLLVAWNVWLAEPDVALARRVAAAVRGPHLRALGLPVAGGAQVSMNLVAADVVGPAEAWDRVAAERPWPGPSWWASCPGRCSTARTPARWAQLDLADERTIEARLARRRGRPPAPDGGPAPRGRRRAG